MQLPTIAPGKRFTLPRPIGSADALLLARLARAPCRRPARCWPSSAADPADTQRLADELPFFEPGLRMAVFPDWETLPYDSFSPHQDLISERLATLWRVLQGEVDVVLLPATHGADAAGAAIASWPARPSTSSRRARLDEARLKAQLTLAGYQHVSQVVSPGEYAVRGGLIDLFPMGSPVPYRVDLFGDEVDSIRTFDPDSQRSLYPVPEVRLLPGPRVPDGRGRAHRLPRPLARADRRRPDARPPLQGHRRRASPAAASSTTCRCSSTQTATIFDYLGAQAALVLHGEVDAALEHFWTDTRERHRFLQHDPERPMLPPEAMFLQGRGLLRADAAACHAGAARHRGRATGRARCPT